MHFLGKIFSIGSSVNYVSFLEAVVQGTNQFERLYVSPRDVEVVVNCDCLGLGFDL